MSATSPSMDAEPAGPARLSVIACCVALAASALPVLGALGIQVGALPPMAGFAMFGAGTILGGGLSVLLASAALIAGRGGRDPQGRRLAWAALVLAVGLLGVVAVSLPSGDPPRINDITTDLADPPSYVGDPSGRGRDMAYPADWVPLVGEAYADLEPLSSSLSPAEALDRAQAVAQELGWAERAHDDAAGSYEANHTSKVFQFVDDIVIRVRPAPGGGSTIDMRSKSRDGQSDLGANAARIRGFTKAF